MNKSQLLKKIAERQPQLAEHVHLWALPALQRFPLDTSDLTKMAAESFTTQLAHMNPGQRLECARNIDARAEALGLDISDSLVHKYAHRQQLADHFASDLELRKEATAHTTDERVEESRITEAVYGTASIVHTLVGIPVCGWTSDEI